MLVAVLALCCCADPGSAEKPFVYADLTAALASQHEGKALWYSVELDSDASSHDGWTIDECRGDSGVLLTVWTRREE
jgi:hypothetical protein